MLYQGKHFSRKEGIILKKGWANARSRRGNIMKKINITAGIQLLCSLVFCIGMMTFLKPCGAKEDGTFMNCHHAGTALSIIAVILIVLSIVEMFVKNKMMQICLSVLTLICGILCILIPGRIISLCMMPEMRCRAITQPGGIIFGVIFIILAAAALLAGRKKKQDW